MQPVVQPPQHHPRYDRPRGYDNHYSRPASYSPSYSSTSPSHPHAGENEPVVENKCDAVCRGFSAFFGLIGEVWLDHHTSIYYDKHPYGGLSETWTTLRLPEKVSRTVEEKKVIGAREGGALQEQLYEDGKETIMYLNRKGKYEFKEIPKYRVRQVIAKKGAVTEPETVTEKHTITESVRPPGKRSFVNVEANGLYSDAETHAFGGAFQTRFAGIIGLIGEYKQFRDQTDKLIFAGFGGELAFVQSGSVSWSFYGQFNGFSGILYLSGVGYGTRLQWFPGGRLGLDFRLGKIEMPDISFWDFHARIGVFISLVQVFVGYRLIESHLAHLQGYETGLQFWF